MAMSKVQRLFTIVGNEQAITLVFQGLIENLEVLRVVVNEQNVTSVVSRTASVIEVRPVTMMNA